MLVLLSSLTRRLQTAAIFFQRRIFCGLSGCCTGSGNSFSHAHVRAASCLQTLSQCQIRKGQVVGSNKHLFFPAQASQTTDPLSECLLSQNAQACATQGLGPNYRKEGKPELTTDWASWVNVNVNRGGIFDTLTGMQRRMEIWVWGCADKAVHWFMKTYKLWHVLLLHRHCETSFWHDTIQEQ